VAPAASRSHLLGFAVLGLWAGHDVGPETDLDCGGYAGSFVDLGSDTVDHLLDFLESEKRVDCHWMVADSALGFELEAVGSRPGAGCSPESRKRITSCRLPEG